MSTYFVEHEQYGPMGFGTQPKDKTLYSSPNVVTLFTNYEAARRAVRRTITHRDTFLATLTNAAPGTIDRDEFNKKWKYRIRRAEMAQ